MSEADPLLSTLCAVCRVQPPRYRCPECNTRYCSVPCNRRHRARTGCTGIRDVTTFVPRSKLCTESGIDRDYNFLQRIETARFSTHKHVVEERGVLNEHDVKLRVLGDGDKGDAADRNDKGRGRFNKNNRAGKDDKRQPETSLRREWRGEELRYVPARPRVPRLAAGDGADAAAVVALGEAAMQPQYDAGASQRVRGLCRRKNITLLGAPRGLARQRSNNTTVYTERVPPTVKGGKPTSEVLLKWQVEWMLCDEAQPKPTKPTKPTCVLRHLLENVPLYRAYVALVAWQRRKTTDGLDANAMMDTVDDDALVSPKFSCPAPVHGSPYHNAFFFAHSHQDKDTGAWTSTSDKAADAEDAGLDDDHLAAKYNLRYYLLRPRAPGAAPPAAVLGKGPVSELIPLSPSDTLATALPGRSVLEFPTLYVMPMDNDEAGVQKLPPGFVLGSIDRKPAAVAKTSPTPATGKRPWANGPSSATKRQQVDEESETSSSGSSSSGEDDSDDEDDEGGEGEDGVAGDLMDIAAIEPRGLPILPVLNGLNGPGTLPPNGAVSDGKPKLVVYDSWSEGSGEE